MSRVTDKPEDTYSSFAQLARAETVGLDFRIVSVLARRSTAAIIAPHGGRIEPRTSAVAEAIAGENYHQYRFEGLKPTGQNRPLHITSTNFDEPTCLDVLHQSDHVVAIHGCDAHGVAVYLGGLDLALKDAIAESVVQKGLKVVPEPHRYPGSSPRNICNRGRRGQGVQLELTMLLRRSAQHRQSLVDAVRKVLERVAVPKAP